jgi:hypothetical protein
MLVFLAGGVVGLPVSWLVERLTGWRGASSLVMVTAALLLFLAEWRGYVKTKSDLDKPTTLFANDAKG